MRSVVAAVIVISFHLVAHAQPADRDAQARTASDEGAARFHQKDFAGAAAYFKQAYELNQDPSYLFNIAQAYRHASDCVNAAEYYRRFLAEVPNPPNEDTIRAWYASQAKCENAQAQTKPSPVSPPPPASTHPRDGSDRRGLVLVLAGTSTIAFVVGGFFAWDAQYLADRRDAALASCTQPRPCSAALANDYDRRGRRAEIIATVGLAAGGVALVSSAILLVTRREKPPAMTVAPVAGGAIVSGGLTW
jgi:tetratricopeptide (TPR) repeat protein